LNSRGRLTDLEAMPMSLRWLVPAVSSRAGGSSLSLEAAGRTDWFIDPSRAADPVLNAPALIGEATGDYLFSARVGVRFAATFDAGALMLYAGERVWAKLCFEYSPQQEPMIVSVVTQGASDDANGFVVDGEQVWLRIARLGPAFAFHGSPDGHAWRLVRHFTLGEGVEPAVGFVAQSPTGEGCAVSFDEIRFEAGRLDDLRSGS
jgi:regulation of enolase protein 1 (concanavalin A-like superfamily)